MLLTVVQDEEQKEVTAITPFTELYETKLLKFELTSDVFLQEPSLFMGDYAVELNLMSEQHGSYFYESKIAKHLINHVGMAVIELVDGSENTFPTLGTVNVLSSKVTTQRLKSMLEYICRADVALLHCCFSKTFLDSSGGNFEYIDLHHKLVITEKTINFLWDNRHKFNNQPCKRIKTVEEIKRYSPKDLVDDRTYSWLLANMNELEEAVFPSDTLINRYGKNLTARNISTSSVKDDRDIYENQVILTFLVSVNKFIDSIEDKNHYKGNMNDASKEFVDIVPFIQTFVSEKLNVRAKLVARIRLLADNCIKFLTQNFTDNFISNLRPRITQYVSRHNHYMNLYRLMADWWHISASNSKEHESIYQLLFSVKSMDKLYEIFVLLRTLEVFSIRGFQLIDSRFVDFKTFPSLNIDDQIEKEPNELFNYYLLENDEASVKLYIEPVIYPYRDDLEEGELFVIDKAPDTRDAVKLFNSKLMRTPDYVLSIQNKNNGSTKIFVLDAKYSKFETVLYERLPSSGKAYGKKKVGLVDKYLHGIRIFNSTQPKLVDGIFAAYISGKPDTPRKVIHGISSEFGLWGNIPMSPFIDLVEYSPVAINSDSQSHIFVSELINHAVNH